MSTEQNKVLIRHLFAEGLNKNNPSIYDEVLAPDFVIYDAPMPMQPGPNGFRQVIEVFQKAFPDLHVAFEAEFADGDYVFHRGYVTGTQRGEFQGIPPSGKKFKINVLDIWHVVNGKAVENWVQMDMLGLMQQIGAIPTPEHTAK